MRPQIFFSYIVLVLFFLRLLLGEFLKFNTQLLTAIIAVILLFLVDYKHFEIKNYLLLFFLFILGLVVDNQSILMLVLLVLVVMCCKYLTIRDVALFCFWGQFFIFAFMAFCVTSGNVPVRVEVFEKGVVYDMGFGNSNTLSLFLFSTITSMYIGLRGRLNTVLLILVYLFTSFLAFYFTKGRTYFVGEILFLVSSLFVNCVKETTVRKYLLTISLIPLIVLMVIIFLLISITQFESLNDILTGRLILWFQYLEKFLESNMLIGYDLAELEGNITLDCSYLTILVATGVLGYSLFSYLFYKAVHSGFSYIYSYFPLLITALVCGLTENIFMSSFPINLLFFTLLYNAACRRQKTNL